MSAYKGTILVAGATGRQGGSVVRHLRAGGFAVRAITRDPDAEKAQPLRAAGVELVRADLTDRASVDALFDGVTGVFSVATPFEAGLEAEVAQGRTLGDAAATAGVDHYVYSSVGGADRDSKVPHFESKWAIENHLRGLGLPLTVVRPVYFFENFGGWSLQPSGDGYTMAMPLSPDRPMQAVAADDIGAFVAMAFADPAAWIGREFELAGDERTLPEYAAAISAARGVAVEYVRAPWEGLREQNEDLYRMYDFFEREGYAADIAALRAEYPRLKTFDDWLGEGGLAGLGKAA
ncbi:MAG TPA: NmrA/HSCARG family protein [Thermoleophilia bacterium]